MPPLETEQLNFVLSDLKRGNAEALDEILSLVGNRMLALARGIVGNPADAEDVVEESFLKIARGISSFREGTNGYAWIMRIVKNASLDFLRKRKRTATENLDDFFHLSDERDSAERREEALELKSALEKLFPAERKMIVCRYFLEDTVREIALKTHMSKSAAGRALLSAEKKLRSLLEDGRDRETSLGVINHEDEER